MDKIKVFRTTSKDLERLDDELAAAHEAALEAQRQVFKCYAKLLVEEMLNDSKELDFINERGEVLAYYFGDSFVRLRLDGREVNSYFSQIGTRTSASNSLVLFIEILNQELEREAFPYRLNSADNWNDVFLVDP